MSDAATASSFLCSTVLLLQQAKERGVTHLDIYTATGLTPNWLSALLNERIQHPSVLRVQKLHDYLTSLEHA